MKAGARGTAGSAVAPPTRRQPLANAPALAELARGLQGACQPTHLEEDFDALESTSRKSKNEQ